MPAILSIRIKAIQKKLGITETGVFDRNTCLKLIKKAHQTSSSTNLVTLIKKVQRIVHADDDGVPGTETVTKVEAFLNPALPKIPAGASLVVSAESLEMLVFFEVTSKEVYDRKYQTPQWPGGASGVSVGIGYDMGYFTPAQVADDWGPHISARDLPLLLGVTGITGLPAKAATATVQSVKINFDKAVKVFYMNSLPEFGRRTRRVYPGIEKLPPTAQGVLLSLVYNRGASLDGERRKEMKNIVPLVAAGNLAGIATELRNMKRLWPDFKGLRDRREKEAIALENASFDILPENLVIL
jgi:hypothetical protein